MKKSIKALTVFLACLMLVFCFAGCKDNGKGKAKDPNKVVSGELGLVLPTYDVPEGAVVKVVSHSATALLDKVGDVFEKGYGGTIEVTQVGWGEVNTKFINSVLAEDPFDLSTQGFNPATVRKNVITPWNDLIDISTNLWDDVRETVKMGAKATNGKIYAIAPTSEKSVGVWYNKEIFEEYAVKTPREYVAEDNWTWLTMRDCAMALTVDTNNDGVMDIYGLSFDNPWNLLSNTGAGYLKYDENGNPSSDLGSDRISKMMNYYSDLWNVDRVIGGGGVQGFKQGKLAMLHGGWWQASNMPELIESDSVYYVPEPKSPYADAWYVTGGSYGYVLASNSKNKIAAAAAICSARYAQAEQYNQFRKGNYGYDEHVAEGGKMSEDLFKSYRDILIDNKYIVSATGDGYYAIEISWNMWMTGIIEGKPWATVKEAVEPTIEQALADAARE